MSNFLLKAVLLISATALIAVKAEKMDFSYNLEASKTVCVSFLHLPPSEAKGFPMAGWLAPLAPNSIFRDFVGRRRFRRATRRGLCRGRPAAS